MKCVESVSLPAMGDDYWSTTKFYFLDVNAIAWCGGGLLVNIILFFLLYQPFSMWTRTIGRFFFWCTYDSIWEKTICWYFFFSRQTWLRGTHAAPTIEGYWLTKQHGRHISFFIWNFQIWEMTIDRQRSCNSFDVYAMTRYGGGLLVNIFSII